MHSITFPLVVAAILPLGADFSVNDAKPAAFHSSYSGLAYDSVRRLYGVEQTRHRVIQFDGVMKLVIAGTGDPGYSGDGGPAKEAQLRDPTGIGFDRDGNLYISDTGNHVVRRVDASTGVITTVVGNGAEGNSGDKGLAVEAELTQPTGLAFDQHGRLYIADSGADCVRRVDLTTGVIATVASADGTKGFLGPYGLASNGEVLWITLQRGSALARLRLGSEPRIVLPRGLGSEESLSKPEGVAVGLDNNLYVADTDNNRVCVLSPLTFTFVRPPIETQRPRALVVIPPLGPTIASALDASLINVGGEVYGGLGYTRSRGGFRPNVGSPVRGARLPPIQRIDYSRIQPSGSFFPRTAPRNPSP
ncbi:Serine/threonine-protein kinase PknD [Planctomycetes bacterium Pan216]|uniref:Serine/threonine-protein kinase PknD n=1 Tax=Kolteria novifilia TaxID=2527975 RepID=A0A518AX65_9BACT|nr:Serine/threonine-protein kinase PknD [Planctomycetes bacterium Pan216]